MADVTGSDPLLAWRGEFPILEESNYLISNSLGAMPRGVYDSLREYADTWAHRGIRAWGEGWWELNGAVGDRIGAIIGARPGSVSVHPNASIAVGVILSGLDFAAPRDEVVIEAGIFPSIKYVLDGMLPPGATLRVAASDDGGHTVDVERVLALIGDRTRLVVVSHVLFRSAAILDIAAIAERARRFGALVLVDGYHATGIVPVDVEALAADFYVSGVLKWMCGGPGGVFLHAGEQQLRSLRPRLTGWMAHRRPFDFDLELGPAELRGDAYRLLNGTPHVPCLYAIRPGVEILAAVGVARIRAKSLAQTARILAWAEARGFTVRTPRREAARGGTVVVDPPHSYELSRELIARGVLVDFRAGSGIRISPHFYNTDGEVDAALAAIDETLETGAWRRHAASRDFVT
jgi:kynureninase